MKTDLSVVLFAFFFFFSRLVLSFGATSAPTVSSSPTFEPSCRPTSSSPSSLPSSRPSFHPSSSPSSKPSGEPTGWPSSFPSSQPTTVPSGQPTKAPSSQPSTEPTGQPSSFPSSQPSAEPSAQPTKAPSSQPSSQPSAEPSGQPTKAPSSQPSSQPTGQPSSFPSSQPSAEPSAQPTDQPTSHPTLVYPMGATMFEGGGNKTHPIIWTVDSLGYANRGGDSGALYLTVDVWPTHFENKGLEYATVKVNNQVIDQYCTPDEECGTEFYTCFNDVDVQSYIQEPLGGILSFEVSSKGVPDSVCNHFGYSLYARIYLREALPTSQPSGQPTIYPTTMPSTVPSTRPSGSPTALPTPIPSGQPSAEPSAFPSTIPSSSPTATPTSHPSSQPSTQPTSEPSSQPTGLPTSLPTDQPSAVPSAQPSCVPSSGPTSQPSSVPTREYPQSLSFSGGGDGDNPVVWDVDSLGFVDNGSPLYLSVEIYPTNYENSANQYATVKVNGDVVSAHCSPDESCGSEYYSCVSELDVSGYRLEELGGSLSVEVTSTGLNYGPCDHMSKPLYARMFLRETLPTGEPTTQPSGEPTGQPSRQPTSEPSSQPTSQPSGDPTFQPSNEPTSYPSGLPTFQPSSMPSSCPSGTPTAFPTGQPSGQPTGLPTSLPTDQPSAVPTAQPSCVPSSGPTSQPSSVPTREYPQSLSFSGGGDGDNPVVWDVDSLGFVDNGSPLYLSVEIYPTNYENSANQYATVKVNGDVVSAHCSPDESCGSEYYSCVSELDVSGYRLEELGGSLSVEVTSTGLNYGPCDHMSKPLYARMFLRETLPTGEPTTQPSGEPTGQPSRQPTSEPSSQPTGLPTSLPTDQPSAVPSAQPSCVPSSGPTSQPSSVPTREYPQSLSFSGGGDGDNPVVWDVDSLGFVDNGSPLYLSVEIYPTNYENSANQYATVKVNGDVVSAHCSPDESCGSEYYSCVSELDVSGYRLEELGGSLSVEVTSTGLNYGPCDHMSKPLYARMFLRETLPTGEPTTQPSGEPTGQPSRQPTSEPSSQPTCLPTSLPTDQPSAVPSAQPSCVPSSGPTSQPSSVPTREYPQSLSFSGGGDGDNPVVWDVDSLGFVDNGSPLYLSVEIYPTNYENSANQYATVKVNGDVVSAHCSPDESCGSEYYSCVSELDVSGYRLEELGGSLSVEVTSTGLNYGPCDHMSKPLYARMFLRETLPTGEPTTQPSGEPTGQPSRQPTSEPSSQPTSQPSCIPSSVPTSCPSSIPSGIPTSTPSTFPSGAPSCPPSSAPSAPPSQQPTSNPTVLTLYNDDYLYYGGGDDDNPVEFKIRNIGFVNKSRLIYLSVSIYATNFEIKGEQWASVRLNDDIIDAFCTPDVSCVDAWHSCVSWMEVSNELSPAFGGSLSVEVSSHGVSSGPCDYEGYPLYARVYLTELPPPEDKETLTIWAILGGGIFFILLLLVVGWLCYSRGRNKVDKYDPPSSGDNHDPEEDPEANNVEVLEKKPSASPRQSPRGGSSKVFPVDQGSKDDLELVDHDLESDLDNTAPKSTALEKAPIKKEAETPDVLEKKSWLINYELEDMDT